jgi:hypothetical protein
MKRLLVLVLVVLLQQEQLLLTEVTTEHKFRGHYNRDPSCEFPFVASRNTDTKCRDREKMESNELRSGERKGRRKERRLLRLCARERGRRTRGGRLPAVFCPNCPKPTGQKKVKIWADHDTNDRADPKTNCRAKRTKGGGEGGEGGGGDTLIIIIFG